MLETVAFVGAVGMIIWVAYLSIKLDDANVNRKKKWRPNGDAHQVSPPAEGNNGAAK